MRSLSLIALVSLSVLATQPAATAADPVAELGSFSVFQGIDPAQLLKGDVKTARGPAMDSSRDLSVQSCYVVPGSPQKALDTLQNWDPTRHRELKVYLHSDMPGSPTPASFGRLGSAPDNQAVRTLVKQTAKLGSEVQISQEEAKKFTPGSEGKGPFPAGIQSFWAGILAGRAQEFAGGGAARVSSYDHTGKEVRPAGELGMLLRSQGKIQKQFSSFLGEAGVTGGKASLKTEGYWELIEVEDDGVLTLGSFASKPVNGGFQAVDLLYYASGGYYVALTLYQMWPVQVGGQPATLVWRGDLISSASLASLHVGMEKLASESAMMKDISRAVNFLKHDTR
jgi:hypothetical protein